MFQILFQGSPSQIDLTGCEKVSHVFFELRRSETDDSAAQAAKPLLGEQLVHLLPIRFHKSPGQFSAIDVAQNSANEKWRVLGSNVSADGTGERTFEQCFGLECREREEIAAFFLRRGGGTEPLVEFLVP